MKNSPTKLADAGIARVAMVTIRKITASTGAFFASPPIGPTSSDPVRSAIIATIRKAGTTTRPWLTICRTAPFDPDSLSAKIPARMNPSWATEENPSTSLMSVVVNAIDEP